MTEIKVIKTTINQIIEVELPEGYVLDTIKEPSLHTFLNEFKIPIIKVEPTLRNENE